MPKLLFILFVGIYFLFSPSTTHAAREFKVYPAQTAFEGEVEVALWHNYTTSNSQPYTFQGDPLSKTDLMEYSLELEYGVTDRFTVEGYADFEQPKGEPFQYVQAKAVFARYHLFLEDEKFWNTSIYIEYSLPREKYNPSEEIEARLILEKAVHRWTVRLNPIFTKKMSGPQISEGIGFEYAAGIYWRNFHYFVPGVEFFGDLGELKNTPSHAHYIFPTIEWHSGSGWRWETGIGFGLTDESDRMIIKNILLYSFLL
ncbi:MAG: hypothetical protein HY036_11225 [Nitrospirae bacterium]|nr:hypothetical protein [Nitrospirota bacterium]MBI3353133.1 hypothetical protein [Nitrospirota bacterium]